MSEKTNSPTHDDAPAEGGGYQTSSVDTFTNPLHAEDGAVGEGPGGSLAADQSQPDSDPDGTAAIVSACVNGVVTLKWQMPLTPEERGALEHDLTQVFKKYDVPNLPYQEELSLVATVGGIAMRRIVAKKEAAAAAAATVELPRDPVGNRQEGVGQVRPATQDMFASPSPGVADFLSRS